MLAPAPEGCVLVLHSPPKGHCDGGDPDTHFGSEALLAVIEEMRPRLAVFGHIHEAWGCDEHRRRLRRCATSARPVPGSRFRWSPRGGRGFGAGRVRVRVEGLGSGARRAGAGDADRRRRGRQPQPGGGQRRPAGHRQGTSTRARRWLNLVAVGYSLGLAALGPLPRRDRRPLRPQDLAAAGDGADDPGLDRSPRWRRRSEVLFARPGLRRRRRRDGLPDHAGADHGALVGAARTKSIALWSALGGGIVGARPAARRGAAGSASTGGRSSSSPLPLAAIALYFAWRFVPAHVNETTEPVDHLGGILSIAAGRLPRAGDQPGAGTGQGDDCGDPRHPRARRHGRLHPAPAPRHEPLI